MCVAIVAFPTDTSAQVIGQDKSAVIHFLDSISPGKDGVFSSSCAAKSDQIPMTIYAVIPRTKKSAFVIEIGKNSEGHLVTANMAYLTSQDGVLDVSDAMGGNWTHDNLLGIAKFLLARTFHFDTSYDDVFRHAARFKCPVLTTTEYLQQHSK